MSTQRRPLVPEDLLRRDLAHEAAGSIYRAALATALCTHTTTKPVDYVHKTWGNDRAATAVLRAASVPASTTGTGWAAELAQTSIRWIASLVPISAGAAMLSRGLQVTFDGERTISFPTIAQGQAGFVGQGKPIAVVEFATAVGVKLEPHKLGLIAGLTREMVESSEAETIVSATLGEAAAIRLDAALFSANASTPDAPSGLLWNITPLTASTATPPSDAMVEDLAALGGSVARVAGSNLAYVCAPEQALAVNLRSPDFAYPVLASKALPKGTLICVASNALVSGFDPVPRIEKSIEATIHYESMPADIVTPAGQTATPVATVYQGDGIALKMTMRTAWALRAASAIAWLQNSAW